MTNLEPVKTKKWTFKELFVLRGRQFEVIKDPDSKTATVNLTPPRTILTLRSIMGSTLHFTYVNEQTGRECMKIVLMEYLKLVD